MAFVIDMFKSVYTSIKSRINIACIVIVKTLALSEENFAQDRVTYQETTKQTALLQFMQVGKGKIAISTTIL